MLARLGSDHPATGLVHRYYRAIAKQDYAGAFECLSANLRTPEGAPLTVARFIQREQATDAAIGRLRKHALTNISHTSTAASCTVKVRRAERSYWLHPRVTKEEDGWRITGFDRAQLDLTQPAG